MPIDTQGRLYSALTGHAEDYVKNQREDQIKAKQHQIDLYKGVLQDPNATAEQRTYAAQQLNQLFGIGKGKKGEDSAFTKVAGFFNKIGERMDPSKKPQSSQPNAAGAGPASAAPPSDPHVNPAQKNLAERALGKVSKGLGALISTPDKIFKRDLTPVPGIDASMFPSADQARANKVKGIEAEQAAKWPYEEKRIRLQEELRLMTAQQKVHNAMGSKTKYPGAAILGALPEAARQGATDINGLPIDPNGLYGPANGQDFFFDNGEQGHPILQAVRVGTGTERESTSEQLVIDPQTNMLVAVPLKRTTGSPAPPQKKFSKDLPTLTDRTGSSSKQPVKSTGGGANGSGAAPKRKGGARTIGPYVRPQQFNVLQKQANAINEARNSLVGDEPGQIGGIAKDLDVFKDPQSVKRLSEYIGFINQQLDRPAKDVTGEGAWAAVQWYAGLPQTVNDLQQEALRKFGGSLTPEEETFIADYYRLMGTIGGLRAATGASAARWSFQNMRSELMTPGPVTGYDDAVRRLKNLVQETNVVAKRNPMVDKFDTSQLDNLGKENSNGNPYRK